jgi:DNA repair exonuclease SbcCD nuclease subunit
VIAGDVYDGDWPDNNTGLFFARQMSRLTRENIRVYILSGNHDAANEITRSLRLPEGVHRFSHDVPETVHLPDLPVSLHGQGFATRSEQRNLAKEYPAAEAGRYNIGVLHTSLDGREGHDTYAPCSRADLERLGYDYWALGHIHMREEVSSDPPVWFPGNVQGRHIRETGPKGCLLVEAEVGKTHAVTFEALDVVRWTHLQVPATKAEDVDTLLDSVRDQLQQALDGAETDLVAVRVSIEGATALHGKLMGMLDQLRAEVLGMAYELDPERLWVERVRVRTQPASTVDARELTGPEEEIARVVADLQASEPGREQLLAEVADLLGKLPPEYFRREEATDPRDTETLVSLLEGLPAYLSEKLRGEETS